eukprot:6792425-Pyramimonas_sp.AAC.1
MHAVQSRWYNQCGAICVVQSGWCNTCGRTYVVQSNALQHGANHCTTVPSNAEQCRAMQHGATQCEAVHKT